MTKVRLDIDERVWKLFKGACAAVGRKCDDCVTEIMRDWIVKELGDNKVKQLLEAYSKK